MNRCDVMTLLGEHRNERGIAHWKRLAGEDSPLSSFGIGLTQLRKLAKGVGRDHDLALELWRSDSYDAKIVGLLIDEPAKMTRAQAESQVEERGAGMLAHVFASCDATLAKADFAPDLAVDWIAAADPMRRRCGYLLLYEMSKARGRKARDDAFFLDHVARIRGTIAGEENWVRDAMSLALLGIGKRNSTLHRAALEAAVAIGPIRVDYGANFCEPLDLVKHLSSDRLKSKLGV